MSRPWKQGLLALPGIGVAILPKLACPVCWPAYAGLLSSIGLGFLISAAYLLPLTIAFLTFTVTTLAYRAKKRHGFGPFLIGLFAAIGILLGKFLWESKAAIYSCVGILIAASLWNTWPRREQLHGRPVLAAKDSGSL